MIKDVRFSQDARNLFCYILATKDIGLEVNADKTWCMVRSRERTAGLSHTMRVDNSSIERVEEFKYLGTTLAIQNLFTKKL